MYLFVKFMPVYMYTPVKYSKGVGARGIISWSQAFNSQEGWRGLCPIPPPPMGEVLIAVNIHFSLCTGYVLTHKLQLL